MKFVERPHAPLEPSALGERSEWRGPPRARDNRCPPHSVRGSRAGTGMLTIHTHTV